MKRVMLTICGRQHYLDQEPEVIELVTEGVLRKKGAGWCITYEESELTGLAGVLTTFEVQPEMITLTRKGPLSSQMIFQPGVTHESLYQMEFGALMISVRATRVSYDITPQGGTVDLEYNIEIENTAAGTIDYHLDIRTMQ